jgi:ketosteroid isomerase-like protein
MVHGQGTSSIQTLGPTLRRPGGRAVDDTVAEGYRRWSLGDVDGFISLFADDAIFVIPGSTRLSGDHDKTGFRRILEEVAAAARDGRHKQELVCSYAGPTGLVCVFDNFARIDGTDAKYHSIHEWIFRDGVPQAWMLYLHEYELFERAWS